MGAQYLKRPGKPALAYNYEPCRDKGQTLPLVFFMGGFQSDMAGAKATFLEQQCRERGQAYLRFDYTGHGESEGKFEDGTISLWKQDALDILDHVYPLGPQNKIVLVGSSMGGWISFLVLLARTERIKGMVGLAAAPDFTDDLYYGHLTEEQRAELEEKTAILVPNEYSDQPYTLTKTLITDGRTNFILDRKIALEVPVTLIQGMEDAEVPWEMTARIQNSFTGNEVDVLLIEDGDHRLSRPEDLALIDREVRSMSGISASWGTNAEKTGTNR